MEDLITENGFQIKEHAAVDGIGRLIYEGFDHFNDKQYQSWIKYHIKTCHEKCILGMSNHGLIISNKLN